jgi:hypothetical protein
MLSGAFTGAALAKIATPYVTRYGVAKASEAYKNYTDKKAAEKLDIQQKIEDLNKIPTVDEDGKLVLKLPKEYKPLFDMIGDEFEVGDDGVLHIRNISIETLSKAIQERLNKIDAAYSPDNPPPIQTREVVNFDGYIKPEGGIPASDFDEETQGVLGLAKTALQPSKISEWAKSKIKPKYTADEVGAISPEDVDLKVLMVTDSLSNYINSKLDDYTKKEEIHDIISDKVLRIFNNKGVVDNNSMLPEKADDFDLYHVGDDSGPDIYARNIGDKLVWYELDFNVDYFLGRIEKLESTVEKLLRERDQIVDLPVDSMDGINLYE